MNALRTMKHLQGSVALLIVVGQASPTRRELDKSGSLDRLRAATVASRMRAGNASTQLDCRDISSSQSRTRSRPTSPGQPSLGQLLPCRGLTASDPLVI